MSFSLAKALKHRVVLLSGEEEIPRRRALAEVLAAAAPESDDFDLQHFDVGAAKPDEWLASAGTAPFLSERRTVVVRHLLRAEEPVEPAQLAALPPYALLILVADDEAGDENRQRRLSTIRKAWEKAVAAGEGHVASFSTDAKGLPEAVRAEASRLGVTITPGAIQVLVEMTGSSLSRSIDELEKLALYVGAEGQIREADVRSVVMPSREWNVFRMVDAVAAGDAGEALTQLRVLVGTATKAEDAAFSRILPMMSRQFRLLWQARVCVEAGVSPDAATGPVAASFPEKASIAKEPPYRQGKLMKAARAVSLAQIGRCFEILSETDARLKGMLPSFSAMDSLETMLLDMIETNRPTAVRR